MSKFSNLYDIDGNIINKSPQHKYTLEEVEELVDNLTKKVQENPENEVYKVYLSNAQKWLMHMYDNMSREDLMQRLSLVKDSVQKAKDEASESEQKQIDEINKIMEDFKKQYDNDEIVMDEYVEPIEEVKPEDNETD